MKKLFICLVALMMAWMQTAKAQKVVLYKTSGQTIECDVSELDSIVFIEKEAKLVSRIELSETAITLQPDETKDLIATVLPLDADNRTVTWESSNEDVAEVSKKGKVIANAEGTCTITCSATDGSGVKAECQVTVSSGTNPDPGNHAWVDLDLPSGTLWATCNVGAEKPEEYGDYFAWGETEPKEDYNWSTYKYCKGSGTTITKYCTSSSYGTIDNKTDLEPEDDAATANWGSAWQMPSLEQCQELINSRYTTTTWTTENGVYGRKITSKINGNSIFLSAAGGRHSTSFSDVGSESLYWSRSLTVSNSNLAYYLNLVSGYISTYSGHRPYGFSVRPVRAQGTYNHTLVTSIILSTLLSLTTGETQTLTAIIQPSNATNKNVTWSSSDENIAIVDQLGKVTAIATGSCTITCLATDGSGVKAECKVTVTKADDIVLLTCPDGNHPHVIDLGLPSGTKWCCCNVGASTPEGYGGYYAWGEISTKNVYNWDNYAYYNDYIGYINIGSDIAGTSYDAATVNMGAPWRMPTLTQIEELINNCSRQWTTQNGVNGILVTGWNGGQIFFPAAGSRWDDNLNDAGSNGYYWTSPLNPYNYGDNYGISMYFHAGSWGWSYYGRANGRPVRAVRQGPFNIVSSITLNKTSLSLTIGATQTLTATIQPNNATNKNVTWSSSNENVATVDQSGKVAAIAEGSCTITCSAIDGSGVKAECAITVIASANLFICPDDHHPHAIDLGLPSGTKWCCCNVGANTPEGYGGYYAWGETEEKSVYNWDAYAYWYDKNGNGSGDSGECTNIGSDIAGTSYDAATVNMGSPWRMPSVEQIQELISNCSQQWITQNGVNGILVTGKNGNQIFLPAAGGRWGDDLNYAGIIGDYWSSSLYPDNDAAACVLGFASNSWDLGGIIRPIGQSVRPVRKQN